MGKKIIIEGTNSSGKTTTVKVLKTLVAGLTIIEFHDFYNQHIINRHGTEKLYLPEHWLSLDQNIINQTESYLDDRETSAVEFTKHLQHDNVVFERLILTRVVYAKLLLNIDLTDYLLQQEKKLVEQDFHLIFLTLGDNTLKERLEKRLIKSSHRNHSKGLFHLKSFEINKRKRDLYLHYFQKLQSVKKDKIDTSNLSEKELKDKIGSLIFK